MNKLVYKWKSLENSEESESEDRKENIILDVEKIEYGPT